MTVASVEQLHTGQWSRLVTHYWPRFSAQLSARLTTEKFPAAAGQSTQLSVTLRTNKEILPIQTILTNFSTAKTRDNGLTERPFDFL